MCFRPPDETVETFWFDDEIEADVPLTEDDLEDDFNSVIASLNVGESTDHQQLPDGFEIDQILNKCITEVTVTAVQEQANVLARSLLSDDQHYCKSFCITQFEEISKIMCVLEATPGTPIRADKVTEVETEILRYKRSDTYRLSCLLMFAKHHGFSGAHSFICTTLTDGVSKFLLHGKTKPYREKERTIHARVITDASRARIRYVAGYCVSKLLKRYTTSYRSNMFSATAYGQQNYYDAKEKMSILNSTKEEEQYLKMYSSDKQSLADTERKQNLSRGLLNVSDEMFEFCVKLCSKCLELMVDRNLMVHGQAMHQYCVEMLLKSDELFQDFIRAVTRNRTTEDLQTSMDCPPELIVRDILSSTVTKVHNIHKVFADVTGKFLMVMFNQFRKDLLHSFSVAKTMAHRKQIMVKQQKRQLSVQSVSFQTIADDKSVAKEMSHSLLRGLIMSNISVLEQMKKTEIAKLGRAYGVSANRNIKKAPLIDIVKKSITRASCMPNCEVFEERQGLSKKKHSGEVASMSEPQPSRHAPMSEPQPSTSAVMSEPQPSTSALMSEPQPSTSAAQSPTDELPVQKRCSAVQSPSSESHSSSEDEVCGKCQKVGKEGTQWIQCSSCLVWYHRNCTGLRSKTAWKKYQSENVDYFCKQCQ